MATKKIKGTQVPKIKVQATGTGVGRYIWDVSYRRVVIARSIEDYRTEKLALAAWDRFFDMVTKGNIYLELPE